MSAWIITLLLLAPGPAGAVPLAGGEVWLLADLDYAANDNPRQRLDLYLPAKRASAAPLPLIVFIHGGGWERGSKEFGRRRVLPFVRSGNYAAACINYRLSSEAIWPAQIHDAKAAIRWLRARAGHYGLDPERIAVWGNSAGGHLALMLGLGGDAPEQEGKLGPYPQTGSRVAAVVNFFGVADFTTVPQWRPAAARTRSDTPEARLLGGPVAERPELARAASPVTYANGGDPPVLTVHGDRDTVVSYRQALRLDAALRQVAVPHVLLTVRGGGHGDFGTVADAQVRNFLERELRGQAIDVDTADLHMP